MKPVLSPEGADGKRVGNGKNGQGGKDGEHARGDGDNENNAAIKEAHKKNKRR